MSDIKLWVDGSGKSPGSAVRAKVKDLEENINRQVLSRGIKVANALRSAELRVLKGQRTGKVYRKYPYKSKYNASAPGEAPARRSGNLRLHWNGQVQKRASLNGISVVAAIESGEKYAYYLENGKGMAPRPFVERIKEEAKPKIEDILKESYS